MEIKSINLNKGDYLYCINYFDGKDMYRLETNEAPLNSLRLAIGAVKAAVRNYLELPESSTVVLNSVKFGEDPSISIDIELNRAFPGVTYTVKTKIPGLMKHEVNPDNQRVSVLEHVLALNAEFEKYIKGERAQQMLPFPEEENKVNAAM